MAKEYIERGMVGNRYGKLVVIEYSGSIPKKGYSEKMWLCECDCGNKIVASGRNLRAGKYVSCGCSKKQNARLLKLKHGCSAHGEEDRLYDIWKAMKQRCFNKKNKRFDRYGGRGITVCDEWKNDYYAFKRWSYENGYDEKAEFSKCTIDRINNDGNYEPSNCRWVDMKVQANNRGCSVAKMDGKGEGE